ncbi:hypothetical protein [uncultured Allomuricauda sp.]|uniref:hypothetical protein n=1 Tax=Flagellimonas sp. W118 TaxID=3410791 RepID=UPI002624391B|nr:hypothetical protein [uncultured Allomuricauda sp.]
MRYIVLIGLFALSIVSINAQNTETFPIHLIDNSIIAKRGLEEKVEMLQNNCDWSNKIGKKIDLFWLQTTEGNFFGKVYEYFFDCDNLRLIYWYDNPGCTGLPVDFMIEDLETDSKFVSSVKKHLKNKKKYRQYLNKE